MGFFNKNDGLNGLNKDLNGLDKEERLIRIAKEREQKIIEQQNKKLELLQEKEQLRNLKNSRIDNFNKLKKFDKFSIEYYKNWWNNKFNSSRCFVINMLLLNGMRRTYLIKANGDKFKIDDKEYVIDESLKYYDVSIALYCLDYHENFSLPYKNTIKLNDIMDGLESSGISDVETAINPSTLRRFITSQVIEKVLKGAEMDDVFKFIKIFLILIFVGVAISLLILIQTSGILQNLNF